MARSWSDLLASQHGVFTRAQAFAHGISTHMLADRVRDGFYRPVAPRTYYAGAPTGLPEAAREWCAVLSLKDATISHGSAARHWGLHASACEAVHVTVDPKDWRQRAGVRVHRSRHLYADDVTQRHGLPMTTRERTIIDLFETLQRPDERRAVVADAFRLHQTTQQRICAAILRMPQLKRRGELLHTVELAAGGSHSDGEMRLYEFLSAWGFPTPQRQLIPELEKGRRYIDCALPTYKIAIEYDGRLHLTDKQKHDDIMRDQQLRRLGWHTIRVTDLRMRDEKLLAADIWADIRERARELGLDPPQPPFNPTSGDDDHVCTI